MSSFVFTFGSVRSLVFTSILTYLLVMFYFHTRISKEDVSVSRLERLASDRMPQPKKSKHISPDELHVNSLNAGKSESRQKEDNGQLIAKPQSSKSYTVLHKRPAMADRNNAHKRKGLPKTKHGHIKHKNVAKANTVVKNDKVGKQEHTWQRLDGVKTIRTSHQEQQLNVIMESITPKKSFIFDVFKQEREIGQFMNKTVSEKKVGGDQIASESNKLQVEKRNFLEVVPNVYVFAAYLDERDGRYLRFVSIALTRTDQPNSFFCHFKDGRVFVGKYYATCESHRKYYAAYIISCAVPSKVNNQEIFENGVIISNSTSLKSISVQMKVVSYPKQKVEKTFSMCVPPLFGNISEIKLIEFIEVSKILGAEHFTFYTETDSLNKNLTKVLNMYRRNGDVTLIQWKLPIHNDDIWYHGQSVSVWDCLFRNMYFFKYIVFNDIDEFIVPKEFKNWRLMINALKNSEKNVDTIAAFRFQSVVFENRRNGPTPYFADDIKSLVTLNTIWRNGVFDKKRTKMIVDSKKVFEIGIHHLSKPIGQNKALDVSPEVAVIHHYKKCEFGFRMSCRNFIQDNSMWRFYTEILDKTTKAKSLLAS